MKNGQDFTTSFLVEQSPGDVFNAINDVRGWWTQNIESSTNHLGDSFKVDFGAHWWAFKIIEMLKAKKVVWLVTGSYMPWNKHETEWTDTKISFEISQQDGKTQMRFTHIGLTPSFNCFEGCSKGWTGYIQQSLEPLIRTGRGTPDVDY